jgi:hypothetical protein
VVGVEWHGAQRQPVRYRGRSGLLADEESSANGQTAAQRKSNIPSNDGMRLGCWLTSVHTG